MTINLHPDHLTDLRKSGLTDETIIASGIKSVRPTDIDAELGFPTYAKSAYRIPYPETGGYERFKVFYDEQDRINLKTGEERPNGNRTVSTGSAINFFLYDEVAVRCFAVNSFYSSWIA